MIYYSASCFCASLSGWAAIHGLHVNRSTLLIAIIVGCLAATFKLIDQHLPFLEGAMPDTFVWGTVTSFVGILLVFRAGQSYSRFAEGCTLMHVMQADFVDVASLLICMSRCSTAGESTVLEFRRIVVRLMSCLNMVCLYELGSVEVVDLDMLRSSCLDLDGLDDNSLQLIGGSKCKPDVTCQLLQNVICEALKNVFVGVPPPLLTRAFQELGGGMIRYHEARKLRDVPYPFPLSFLTEIFLFLYSIYTPLQMGLTTNDPVSAAIFAAVFTFLIWTLYGVATELDDPFGDHVNDLDLHHVQRNMNHSLLSLVSNGSAPATTLKKDALDEPQMLRKIDAHVVAFQEEKRNTIKITRNESGGRKPKHEWLTRRCNSCPNLPSESSADEGVNVANGGPETRLGDGELPSRAASCGALSRPSHTLFVSGFEAYGQSVGFGDAVEPAGYEVSSELSVGVHSHIGPTLLAHDTRRDASAGQLAVERPPPRQSIDNLPMGGLEARI